MKKLLAVILSVMLVCSVLSFSVAEEEETAGTHFEQVLLKKGSLIKKEFIDIATIDDDSGLASYGYGNMTSQAAILTDMTNGAKVYALRLTITYFASQYDSGEKVGVLDLEEIDSVISTLKSLKNEFAGNLVDYTEFLYTSNSGMKVGGYHTASSDKLLVQFTSSISAVFNISRVDELIKFFEDAKTDIEGRM